MISPRTRTELKREFRRNSLAKVGVALTAAIVLLAAFAPLVAPHDPTEQDLENASLPPLGFSKTTNTSSTVVVNGTVEFVEERTVISASVSHPLGTDPLGRDMLSRVIYGARTSLLVGILGTALAVLIGAPIGFVSGYFGRHLDAATMRVADVMLAFPALVLAIALLGLFGRAAVRIPDPWVQTGVVDGMPETVVLPGMIIVVVALISWVKFARVARGEALSIKEEDYVKAARSMGGGNLYVVWRHVIANGLTPVLVLGTIQIATVILYESALSFLGFSGTTLSWGFDIAQGRDYLASAWWIATVPGVMIMVAVVGINFVGDYLRDALDPSIQGEEGT